MTDVVMDGRRILVGVDGSRAARNAVLWAAQEAQLRRAELLVTHVDPPSVDAVGLYGEPVGSEAILEASAAAASQRAPSVTVATLLLRGGISDELIRVSASATLLVVGVDPAKPRAAHGLLGPIEDRVVVHAGCPVVTVSGPPPVVRGPHPTVVVDWSDDEVGHAALHAAAVEATARGASLTVVSVLPADDQRDGQRNRHDRAADVERALAKSVAALEEELPDLFLNVIQEEGDAVATLVHHARSAELLVVGCPHAEDRWSIRTGPVAGALLRSAPCPVMLVTGPATEPAPGTAERQHPRPRASRGPVLSGSH
jgi:nucleotide-binding universal stress UspA family protein